MKKSNKAFTLIEMLIVIVIIGILAAALVPRLISVQGRARDTKRKADLQQIGSALAIYKTDWSFFPKVTGAVSTVLVGANALTGYLTAVPTDPQESSATVAADIGVPGALGYGYMAINRNTQNWQGSVLAAQTESDGTSSNMTAITLTPTTEASSLDAVISGCGGRVTKSTVNNMTGDCTSVQANLRYYYVQ